MAYLTAGKQIAVAGTMVGERERRNTKTLLAEVATAISTDVAAHKSAAVASLGATTNIDAVPEAFADEAAVQAYLAGANVIPNIEARLDAIESKVNALLAALRDAGLMASS
jgi:hypothetical protein